MGEAGGARDGGAEQRNDAARTTPAAGEEITAATIVLYTRHNRDSGRGRTTDSETTYHLLFVVAAHL